MIAFLGIGAQKSGTSYLARLLDQHPEIYLSEPKELNFFHTTKSFHRSEKNEVYDKGITYYESFFRNANNSQLCAEFSPNYFYCPDAAARIHKHYQKRERSCLQWRVGWGSCSE